jgi:hypothetical protein
MREIAMNVRIRIASWILCSLSALVPAAVSLAAAQTRPALPQPAAVPSEKDVADTQEQFLHLLRLSPVLTTVVARDPSLLSDQEYVARNNPELAQFITSHPDIAKNPEFYLFSHLENGHARREQALERAVWPDLIPPDRQPSSAAAVVDQLQPIIIVPIIFLAFVWVIRLFFDSRRWSRTFKQQSELQARLIDKFGTSQELAAYLESDAGKRFLMASPVALGPEAGPRMPNVVARVLTPLQAGIVVTLLGIGLLLLRHAGPDLETGMTVLGTLVLAPGLGFILSAGVTWVLAHRLGLMPEKEMAQSGAGHYGSQDRQ